MQIRDRLIANPLVLAVPGLAILGCTGVQPAFAQATPKTTHSVGTKDAKTREEMADKFAYDMDESENDPAYMDPQPMNYPYAAPGSLNLNHWTDYTRLHTAPGSAQEEREERMRMRDLERRRRNERFRALSGRSVSSAYTPDNGMSPGYYSGYDNGSNYGGGYQSTSQYSRTIMGPSWSAWSPMATYGDSVYMVRGNTLYKLNSSDLSVARQQDLPAWTGGSMSSFAGATTSAGVIGDNGDYQNGGNGADNNSNRARRNRRRDRDNMRTDSSMQNGRWNGSMAAMAPVSVTAGSDFVYVMRGDTLYQLRTADLSMVTQKSLPSIGSTGLNGSSTTASPSTTTPANPTNQNNQNNQNNPTNQNSPANPNNQNNPANPANPSNPGSTQNPGTQPESNGQTTPSAPAPGNGQPQDSGTPNTNPGK